MNWISATGRRPWLAMPMDMPAIMPSASGVSCTRSLPNFSCRPAVARNTPPFTPTSSPSTTTVGSCAISHACARLMASIIVTLAMAAVFGSVAAGGGVAPRQLALLRRGCFGRRANRKSNIAVRVLLRRVQVFLDGGVDLAARTRLSALLRARRPSAPACDEIGAQAQQRLGAPRVLHFLLAAIAASHRPRWCDRSGDR